MPLPLAFEDVFDCFGSMKVGIYVSCIGLLQWFNWLYSGSTIVHYSTFVYVLFFNRPNVNGMAICELVFEGLLGGSSVAFLERH